MTTSRFCKDTKVFSIRKVMKGHQRRKQYFSQKKKKKRKKKRRKQLGNNINSKN